MEIGSADDFESAFKEAIKVRSAGLAVTSGALALSSQKRVADLATKIGCRRFTLGEILSLVAA
jgi:hypothetical protein